MLIYLYISNKNEFLPDLYLDGELIKNVKSQIRCIKLLKFKINRKSLEIFYFSFIRSVMEYGDVLFAGASAKDLEKINKIELEAMRVVTGTTYRCSSALLKLECGWENISQRRNNHVLILLFKVMKGDAPNGLKKIFYDLSYVPEKYNLRKIILRISYCRTSQYKQSFFPLAIKQWNSLSYEFKSEQTLKNFNILLQYLLLGSIFENNYC